MQIHEYTYTSYTDIMYIIYRHHVHHIHPQQHTHVLLLLQESSRPLHAPIALTHYHTADDVQGEPDDRLLADSIQAGIQKTQCCLDGVG